MLLRIDQRKFHILESRGPLEEVKSLKDKTDLPVPDLCQFIPGKFFAVDPIQQVETPGGPVQKSQDIHEG